MIKHTQRHTCCYLKEGVIVELPPTQRQVLSVILTLHRLFAECKLQVQRLVHLSKIISYDHANPSQSLVEE